jgi:enoyl-CoA hydratase
MLLNIQQAIHQECEGRKREALRRLILQLQDDISSLERCRKPVIAAIHGACIGGGIDLVTAADIRFASADAYFAVREIDMGMTADVGTLQRLPRIVGEGVARELCLTGRRIDAAEAAQLKLVNQVFDSQDALLAHARQVAASIAGKSPLAVRGTKQVLNYSRDHSVADSLEYVANWNAAMLLSNDIQQAVMASMSKRTAQFAD